VQRSCLSSALLAFFFLKARMAANCCKCHSASEEPCRYCQGEASSFKTHRQMFTEPTKEEMDAAADNYFANQDVRNNNQYDK
tara:strand:+ start:10782 stop:11027 length:246 start_codon:yes stop_codon:yes gene_type:complete